MNSTNVLEVHSADNILVALQDLAEGTTLELGQESITLVTNVKAKHKFARTALAIGDHIIMYGTLIGVATAAIQKGEAITTNNVKHASADYQVSGSTHVWEAPDVSTWKNRTFSGYHRPNGNVGTANYWLLIPLVFCENKNIELIKDALVNALGYKKRQSPEVDISKMIQGYESGEETAEILEKPIFTNSDTDSEKRVFENVDGIKFLTHEGGCGGTREDAQTLCNLLAGYITNANVAGATVLSLGCQHAQIKMLQQAITERDLAFDKPLTILEQQGMSHHDFIDKAVKHTFVGMMQANKIQRQPAPLSKLTIGLECGGSDGFSGISANPTLGYLSDLLVALGGSVVLSEFPELNGVEQELVNRCQDISTAQKFKYIMQAYQANAVAVGSGFENNPSPGNIKDGLITDAMKSAGAAKKGGTSPVVDVLDYTEPVQYAGLNLLCTPGNDVESTTGMAGSGANLIIFTTGLGTPTGNPISPTIKVSTNTELYNRMPEIIDFDTGTIIAGNDTIQTKGSELLEYVIKVASGEISPAAVQLGQDDFIPWKRGVSL